MFHFSIFVQFYKEFSVSMPIARTVLFFIFSGDFITLKM